VILILVPFVSPSGLSKFEGYRTRGPGGDQGLPSAIGLPRFALRVLYACSQRVGAASLVTGPGRATA